MSHGREGDEPGFWRAGAELGRLEFKPFAADDPAASARQRGRLPGDLDGSATEHLVQLYCVLADGAENAALGSASDANEPV